MRCAFLVVFVTSALSLCLADMYLHNPRGSNNRLNEKSATRRTGNRVFDSQNNARGGYNVGDRTDKKAGNNAANQYQMEYFMSGPTTNDVTELLVEWTNQHGCGDNDKNTDPSKLNCNIVIQYMQQMGDSTGNEKYKLRDGTSTSRQNYRVPREKNKDGIRTFSEDKCYYNSRRKNRDIRLERAYHEPHEWYDSCRARFRNKGLFTADQDVKEDRATHTRQNPNGNRNGYECAEERDYYPYWHPTPWKDVMVFTEDGSRCNDYFKKESFNVKPKGECVEKWPNSDDDRHYSSANTKELCEKLGGKWVEFYNYHEILDYDQVQCEKKENSNGYKLKWATPYRAHSVSNRMEKKCLALLKAPGCDASPFSRHNHLGNGKDLEPLRYKWELPIFEKQSNVTFVLRIRYNISTDDYNPQTTFSELNGDSSPITNNPLVDIGAYNKLQLALNTAQTGRTFEDRTHTSYFVKRPDGISGKIHNLNVRGKRGNIVQTFPAVEYDFIPNVLEVTKNELIHVQWTGSNSHNNGGPGGDGQTGDAGQGTGGTDRSNIVSIPNLDSNFPSPMIKGIDNICHNMDVVWQKSEKSKAKMDWSDICVKIGSAGYYDCVDGCSDSLEKKDEMNNLLNNAPASFSGMLVKMNKVGEHHYTCTRNNAFTNRSQKGTIVVK